MSERQRAVGPPKSGASLQDDIVSGAPLLSNEALTDDELDALCETLLAAMGDEVPPVPRSA